MSLRRTAVIGASLLVLAAAIGTATLAWRDFAVRARAARAIAEVDDLLRRGDARAALRVIQTTRPPRPDSPLGGPWFDAQLAVALANRQFDKLARLQAEDSVRFALRPDAVTWLQRIGLRRRNGSPFQGMATRETNVLVLADSALIDGQPTSARSLLESANLSGDDEVNRLLRLALLDAGSPESAWAHVDAAYRLDPRNPDVRTFSANLLEARGVMNHAREEYVAALLLDPANPRVRDNLAEFYLRQGFTVLAVRTWREAPPTPAHAVLRLKAFFHQRVGSGAIDVSWSPPAGELASRLASIPEGQFWVDGVDAGFEPDSVRRPEVFLLRVFEELRRGDESRSWHMLAAAAPALIGSHRVLAGNLQALLAARAGSAPMPPHAPASDRAATHPLWAWLGENAARPQALQKPWVVPTLLAVSGWCRAAIDLAPPEAVADAPEWAVFALARSAGLCGEPEQISKYLRASPLATHSLQMLRAEQAWREKRFEEGCGMLAELLTHPDAGARAAWLLSLYHLERGDAPAVTAVLDRCPAFALSVTGQEIRARAHLIRNETRDATAIYENLGERSDDGRLWLARAAFQSGDWGQALRWTQSLARDYPNEPQFKKNMESIESARSRARQPALSPGSPNETFRAPDAP